MKTIRNTLLCVLLLFAGCAYQITLTDFQSGETLPGTADELTKITKVTMPDPEHKTGKNDEESNAAISLGTTTGYMGTTPVSGMSYGALFSNSGQAYTLLKSDKSNLMMEVIVNFKGNHGFGEARTNDGRTYKVQF